MVKAVDGVSFSIAKGETLGLVGESGCGKTTLGQCILRFHKPTSGEIHYQGEDLTQASGRRLRELRKDIQMVFQDPYSSLNPRMTAGQIIGEPLTIHRLAKGKTEERIAEIMSLVGLSPAMASRYPHEFSGGQRQRIGIGRALAVDPTFLVCDEAVSALDVSIQAQIINLLKDLQRKLGLTYLFIAHDLAVVRHVADRIAVMYLGHIVEIAPRDPIYDEPLHPYTQALLSAVPVPDPEVELTRPHVIITGEVPSPLNPPSGCVFHPRCPIADERCSQVTPELREVRPGHWAACLKV
jgi:oligopeptide transport system ATP-binding protein